MNWTITSSDKNIWDFVSSILSLEMSSWYQNCIFEVPTKTQNSQTFVQIYKEKSVTSGLRWLFFLILFLLRLLGFFWLRLKYFSRFCNIFPGFCKKKKHPVFPGLALFFQVFQVRWEPCYLWWFSIWFCIVIVTVIRNHQEPFDGASFSWASIYLEQPSSTHIFWCFLLKWKTKNEKDSYNRQTTYMTKTPLFESDAGSGMLHFLGDLRSLVRFVSFWKKRAKSEWAKSNHL